MQSAGWQGGRDGEIRPYLLNPPVISGPDYPALVDILLNLRQPLDLAGETVLTSEEAARIRACGVEARAGKWYCPALPRSVVGPYWRLSHLCDDIEPEMRPVPWHNKRAAIRSIARFDPLWKDERRILDLLNKQPDHRLTRRQLQQRVSRRIWTEYLDRMLGHLAALDRITVHDGWIYPCSRAEFDARQRKAREPRELPRPVSVVYAD